MAETLDSGSIIILPSTARRYRPGSEVSKALLDHPIADMRVAEGVALAMILGLKALYHRHLRRVAYPSLFGSASEAFRRKLRPIRAARAWMMWH